MTKLLWLKTSQDVVGLTERGYLLWNSAFFSSSDEPDAVPPMSEFCIQEKFRFFFHFQLRLFLPLLSSCGGELWLWLQSGMRHRRRLRRRRRCRRRRCRRRRRRRRR